MSTILITGGAGFIGSALVRYLAKTTDHQIVVLDYLTYAGNLESLESVEGKFVFKEGNICDQAYVLDVFKQYSPSLVMHLAAESHVDRSIDGPLEFINTNVQGTANLLECSRAYWQELSDEAQAAFRFHHISTDEVYGSLGETGLFTETTPYSPNSPYSASKASSDHLVRAWFETYKMPTLITNCSNNYGPYHFPEKLIPLVILNALDGKALPIYGKGEQIRDWLFVDDHVEALYLVAQKGKPGETYNIGGNNEMQNIEVVKNICHLLDELKPGKAPYAEQITFVKDRPGHDQRYAIDASKIKNDLGWSPRETFETGLKKTVQWYLDNKTWCQHVQDGSYRRERLGLGD